MTTMELEKESDVESSDERTCDRCGDPEGTWVSVRDISWHSAYSKVCGSCLLTAAVDPFGEASDR